MVGPQPEEQGQHDQQVEDRDQAPDVGSGAAQRGQVPAEGQDHDHGAQRPRPAALGQPLRHLIRGALHVVAGRRLLLGNLEPQVIQLGCLVPEHDRLLRRGRVLSRIRAVVHLVTDPFVHLAGDLVDVQRGSGAVGWSGGARAGPSGPRPGPSPGARGRDPRSGRCGTGRRGRPQRDGRLRMRAGATAGPGAPGCATPNPGSVRRGWRGPRAPRPPRRRPGRAARARPGIGRAAQAWPGIGRAAQAGARIGGAPDSVVPSSSVTRKRPRHSSWWRA